MTTTDPSVENAPREVRDLATRGTEVGARLEGLDAAVRAARGRLDDELLDEIQASVDRGAGRLRLSAQHTVIAIAGATGSGKSSTYNALVGLELSSIGVRRPTTSWASACVWGSEGAEEVLDWLGIPPRHQTMRDSLLDTHPDEQALDGVVLMDLPDHDSTEVAHHLEVDRLVELADLLVWVLDPQKYADAALHDRYLAPYRTHEGVMLVLLNQIDTIPEGSRQAMVDDVRRLLAADGLPDVKVIAISARQGIGMDELRQEIETRVAAKRSTTARVEADIAAAAARLDDEAPVRQLTPEDVADLENAVGRAAGISTVAATVGRRARARSTQAIAWPPAAVVGGLLADPRKRLAVDLGDDARLLGGSVVEPTPTVAPVSQELMDVAVRELTDGATRGLSSPWAEAVGRAGASAVPGTTAELGAALSEVDLGADRLPGWVRALQALQWLILLTALVGGGWWLAAALIDGIPGSPEVAGVPLAALLLVGGLVLGPLLALACRGLGDRLERARAAEVEADLGAAISEVVEGGVVGPVRRELEMYGAFKAGLVRARG